MVCLDDSSVLALDGTGSCSSKAMHYASCLHQIHRNGTITYAHQMVGAASIHPDVRAVMPLRPAPIVTQDGTSKNDGARHAAKQLVATLRQDHPHLTCIVTEDRLSAHAPPIETLHAHHLPSLLGVKAGDHAWLCQQVPAAGQAGRVTQYVRHDRATGLVHRFRFVNQMPLKASNADVRVNFLADWERRGDTVQHFRWVTDFRVRQRNVSRLMQGGRARGKIENETFHTLKNQGDHCEHNDGHGTQNRSVVFAMLMMLAFVVDQTQEWCCALFQAVWAQLGSKRLLWERMRALCSDEALASMQQLLEALVYGLQKPTPSFALDFSSSRSRFPLRRRSVESGAPPSWWGIYAAITRGGCLQQALLSCLIAQVSSKDGNGWSKR